MSLPDFTVEIFQNEFLPDQGRDVNAIVTVRSSGAMEAAPAPAANAAEIIIVDCSGSMDSPPAKLAEARAATAAAVDVVRDGTWFAIVAGTSTAWPVYPSDGSMAIAYDSAFAPAMKSFLGIRLLTFPRREIQAAS